MNKKGFEIILLPSLIEHVTLYHGEETAVIRANEIRMYTSYIKNRCSNFIADTHATITSQECLIFVNEWTFTFVKLLSWGLSSRNHLNLL